MQVNFIYTYSVDMEREQEGFFIVTPPEVNRFGSFMFMYGVVFILCHVRGHCRVVIKSSLLTTSMVRNLSCQHINLMF